MKPAVQTNNNLGRIENMSGLAANNSPCISYNCASKFYCPLLTLYRSMTLSPFLPLFSHTPIATTLPIKVCTTIEIFDQKGRASTTVIHAAKFSVSMTHTHEDIQIHKYNGKTVIDMQQIHQSTWFKATFQMQTIEVVIEPRMHWYIEQLEDNALKAPHLSRGHWEPIL